MTTYRLPDYLGGHPVALRTHVIDGPDTRVDVEIMHPESQTVVNLLFGSLIEVKPPMPPEPADGIAVMVRDSFGNSSMCQRRDFLARLAGECFDVERWFRAGEAEPTTWEHLHKFGRIVTLLVPDPAADAEPLPALIGNSGSHLTVRRDPAAGDALVIGNVGLSQNEIRRLMAICARALKPGAERDELHRRVAGVTR